jgi:hypothetical protein
MRWLGSTALISAAFALTACGAAETERAQPAGSLEPAPQIEAIDEPAPPGSPFLEPLSEGESAEGSIYICAGESDSQECKPTPEAIAEMEKMAGLFRQAVRPAEDSRPRAFARLRITPRGPATTATMIAWRARSGKLCTSLALGDHVSHGPSGPCVPETQWRKACDALCLDRSGEGIRGELRYLLTGTVTARADELRITFVDGRAVRYPLTGPVVPEFPQYRAFMLDLGSQMYRRLELLREGDVLERSDVPQDQIKFDRCVREFPIPPPGVANEPVPTEPNPRLKACLRAPSGGDGIDKE